MATNSILNWNAQLECLDKGLARVEHAHHAEHEAQEDDEDVVHHHHPGHGVAPKLQVEDRWPDERQEAAREAADEAHQNSEVRNNNCENDGDNHNENAETEAPDLELAVHGPDGGEQGLWLPHEELLFDEFAGSVVGQGVGQQGLDNQDQVHDCLQPRRQVVHHFLGRVCKRPWQLFSLT